jgi:hypothetical protein
MSITSICNEIGIKANKKTLERHMEDVQRFPFRKNDLLDVYKGTGIEFTTNTTKPVIVADIISELDRGNDKIYNALMHNVRKANREAASKAAAAAEIAAAKAKPAKAPSTKQAADLDAVTRELQKLQVQTKKLEKVIAKAAVKAA